MLNGCLMCLLYDMSWLPVTVQASHGFLQHGCVLALVQYMCVLIMVSSSTTVCFHNTGYGLSQHVCMLAAFTVHVSWLWSPTAHVCTGSFPSMCVYWSWSPTACACAGSFAVHVCTGYGFP